MLLTKKVELRRVLKDYSAEELQKVKENLDALILEQIEKESALRDELLKLEAIRQAYIVGLEEHGIAPPIELKKEHSIKELLPKTRARKTKREKQAAILSSIVNKDNEEAAETVEAVEVAETVEAVEAVEAVEVVETVEAAETVSQTSTNHKPTHFPRKKRK